MGACIRGLHIGIIRKTLYDSGSLDLACLNDQTHAVQIFLCAQPLRNMFKAAGEKIRQGPVSVVCWVPPTPRPPPLPPPPPMPPPPPRRRGAPPPRHHPCHHPLLRRCCRRRCRRFHRHHQHVPVNCNDLQVLCHAKPTPLEP